MPITSKGMSMLLKHHALDASQNSDDDIKNCVDAAIMNSDTAAPEESETGDDDDSVENRADEESEELTAANAKIAELEKKLKGAGQPIHNRNKSKVPVVDVDAELGEAQDIRTASLVENRAKELKKGGTPPATAWILANRQINEELGAGMHKAQ